MLTKHLNLNPNFVLIHSLIKSMFNGIHKKNSLG